jgi:hypothetical protein
MVGRCCSVLSAAATPYQRSIFAEIDAGSADLLVERPPLGVRDRSGWIVWLVWLDPIIDQRLEEKLFAPVLPPHHPLDNDAPAIRPRRSRTDPPASAAYSA